MVMLPSAEVAEPEWFSHLTATNLSIIIAKVLVVSINVITARYLSLTCSFKIGTVVRGILTAECYCSRQCVCFGRAFMLSL